MADPKDNLVALADAVADALNAAQAQFIVPFTAARKFLPIEDLAKLKESDSPLVILHPMADDEERLGGGSVPQFAGTFEVDAVIYRRIGVGEAAEEACEQLMLLRNQIRQFFRSGSLTVNGLKSRPLKAVLAEVDGTPAYGQKTLLEEHCFVSAQTLTFAMAV